MESGIWASVWSFIKFLPFFFALLLLGIIKGALFGPWAWLIMTIGISALILGLWPMHVIWTHYCIIRTKMVGPVVKLLLLIAATAVLVLWLIIGVMGSILAGLTYGFLAPAMATFDAVGEGKEKPLVHCFLVHRTWQSPSSSKRTPKVRKAVRKWRSSKSDSRSPKKKLSVRITSRHRS